MYKLNIIFQNVIPSLTTKDEKSFAHLRTFLFHIQMEPSGL